MLQCRRWLIKWHTCEKWHQLFYEIVIIFKYPQNSQPFTLTVRIHVHSDTGNECLETLNSIKLSLFYDESMRFTLCVYTYIYGILYF